MTAMWTRWDVLAAGCLLAAAAALTANEGAAQPVGPAEVGEPPPAPASAATGELPAPPPPSIGTAPAATATGALPTPVPPAPVGQGPPPYGTPPVAAPPYGAPPVGPAPAWGYPAHSYRPPYGQTPAQLPDTLPYREGRPPPAGYVLESQKYRGLWLSGTITLGATWFMSAISAGMLLDDEKGAVAPLFAPVLGPFIAIGTLDTDSPGTTALLVDGVAQTAGAALLIAGLVAERKVWVRDYFAVTATPVVSKELSGFALIGEM